MSGWARVNFDEVPDVSPDDVPIQFRFARDALAPAQLAASRFVYEPGARMPWGHRHRHQEELYVVAAGSGRARLDDEEITLRPGDVLRVDAETVRSFEAGSEGLDLICIGGPTPERRDGERTPDPFA